MKGDFSLHWFLFFTTPLKHWYQYRAEVNIIIRADITITGTVQMVGFRTFIKNLDDGSVKSVCSGAKSYPMGTLISMKMRLGCHKP